MFLEIHGQRLKMIWEDNTSSRALREYVKKNGLVLKMRDYAHMEKFAELPLSFPQDNKTFTTVAGDLVLYEGKILSLYYDSNTWCFTKIGNIPHIDKRELLALLCENDVIVTLHA